MKEHGFVMSVSSDSQNEKEIWKEFDKQLIKAQSEILKQIQLQSRVLCLVCGKPLQALYCTYNVCQECCEDGKCPFKSRCAAYPEVLEKLKKYRHDVVENPSRRVKL